MRAPTLPALLLFALTVPAAADPPTPAGIESGYQKLAGAIEAKNTADLAAVLAESFRYVPAEGRAMERARWLDTWARNFKDVDAYTAASYRLRSAKVLRPGLRRVVAERTVFFRPAGGARESIQVCRTEDEWAEDAGRWLLRSQRETGFPDDGEVAEPDPPPQSVRLRKLQNELKSAGDAAIEALVEELRGQAPLVEPVESDPARRLVTFVYRAGPHVQNVAMAGGPYREGPKVFTRLEATDLWYRTENLPADAKFVYFLTVTQRRPRHHADGQEGDEVVVTLPTADPLNPRQFNGGSIVWPANAPPPPAYPTTQPTPLRGKLSEHTIRSAALGEERSVTLYTPSPGAGKPTCLLVALDGEDYTSLIPTPAILDDLIAAGRLPPTVAVFVNHQGLRFRDLRCSPAFARFLAAELVPWARSDHGTTDRPDRTAIAGASLGGLAAAYAAGSHPHVFGKVLSQSGAFWHHPDAGQDGWLATQFAGDGKRPIEFWMEVGTFESTSMVLNNRRFRDVLRAKGYPVKYREYNGGHDFLTWRESLSVGLTHLLGDDAPRRDSR